MRRGRKSGTGGHVDKDEEKGAVGEKVKEDRK